jgi:eukaryotic-like serine/threonine-protein kinase
VKPFTPSWLERLTRRCLAKDPEERYHSMRDIVLDLRTPPAEPAAVPQAMRWPWIAVAGVATIAAVMGWSLWLRQPSVTPQVLKLDVMPPEGAKAGDTVAAEISPDGRTLAFISTTDRPRVYLRALDSLEARPLAGTEGATRVFWSPDSKSLAVNAAAVLKRIELATGTATAICNIASIARGTWGEGDVILLSDGTSSLQQVSASGGMPRPLLLPNMEAGAIGVPLQFLPGGREFLYLSSRGDRGSAGVFLGSLDGKSFTPILRDGVSLARYDASSRRILFLQGGAIRAQRLDLDPPRLIGEPVVIASGVTSNSTFSLSRNGTLCYRREEEWRGRLSWRDRTGNRLKIAGPAQRNVLFRLSPDGRRVAFTQVKAEPEVWVTDLEREASSPLVFNDARSPVWSPDGKDIYYTNTSRRGLYRKPADGSGEAVLVASGDFRGSLHSVAPDQRR